ncbi:beta-ketoacyl synthase, N-terminal domain family protein [Aspergillus tubingensis]|uniref:beta-ketoacyl synthase, N-terminal domain family protein n=1 Tax=Aspergillus tubingensis TaxID=5068 RepID=UPI001578A3DE|nr:beta-ketoacyl synthase, N-terminal domain family protein [Aspergillus tubingensis]GFN13109.1 beta-ketoacyl synthase, N-terminal domain family protein [Aspergillus tubingensis]
MPPRRSYKKRYETDQTDRPRAPIENMTMADAGRELQRLTRNIMLAKRNIKRWESEHEELIARFYNTKGKIVVPPGVAEKANVIAHHGESSGEGSTLEGGTNKPEQTPPSSESGEVLGEAKMDVDEDAQSTTATTGCDDQLLPDSGDVGCLDDLMDLSDGPKGEADCLGSALGSLKIHV